MTELNLKKRLGTFIIVSHFFVIILTIVLWLFGGFLFEEMTTTIALIIPMFSIYTTAVIKFINDNKNSRPVRKRNLDNLYVSMAFAIPSLFVLCLISMIILKSLNIGFADFEQFKIMLGLIQTVFGAYVGLVLSSLFEIETKKDKSERAS